MFFLIRSALCIGIVVYMLPGIGGPAAMRDMAAEARSAASVRVQRYCVVNDTCMAVGAKVASLVLARRLLPSSPDRPVPRSISTLEPADLIPAWTGPASRSGG